MRANESERPVRGLFASAAAWAAAFTAAIAFCGNAAAETGAGDTFSILTSTAADVRMADLEQAFWICDYTASTRGVHATPVEMCSAVTDELKQQKFGGDFGEMLEWWRQKKPVEHNRLQALS